MMKPEFARLLEAAKKLKEWETAAEIAEGLTLAGYPVSEQTLSNWKSRGISKEGKLKASQIIGFRIAWLENRTGDIAEPSDAKKSTSEKNSTISYFTGKNTPHPAILEVVNLMSRTDELGKGMILAKVRDIFEERAAIIRKQKFST